MKLKIILLLYIKQQAILKHSHEKSEKACHRKMCAALLVTVKKWRYTAARGHELLNENLNTSHRIPPSELLVKEASEVCKAIQATTMALGCPL